MFVSVLDLIGYTLWNFVFILTQALIVVFFLFVIWSFFSLFKKK